MQHHRGGRLGVAEGLYRQILEADSTHADALHMLGVLALQSGRQQLAVEMIVRAIAQNAQVPSFHNNLGNAYAAAGKWQDAELSYRHALDRKRDYAEAYYNLGKALFAQGKLEDAGASYRHALALRPNHAETYLNLSNVLQAQGKLDEAAEACQRAISSKPNLVAAHNNLGNLLMAQNRFEAALAAYSRTLELKPDLAEAHHNRGLALLNGGRVEEAVACCRQALSYKPDYIQALVTLGHALTQGGDTEEAERSYQRAIALDPSCGEAMLARAITAIPILCGSDTESGSTAERFDRQLDILVRWTGAHPGKLGAAVGRIQPFYLAYRPRDMTAVLCRYGDLAISEASAYWTSPDGVQQKAPEVGSLRQPRSPGPPREADRRSQPARHRIRIAVVSGQVRRHPVWEIILRGLIAHLDPGRFEVFLYHTGAIADEETSWARAQVARFVQGPKSLEYWLTEITHARPDVIFYPEIGMDPSTCTLAALRLAPLQIAGWGHPITTGLPTIDWFVSAELLESREADQHYREKLIRLPGTGVHTEFPALQRDPWGGPPRRKHVVRFALCQQPVKFDPQDDILLARIAKAVGAAEFWLATPANMTWTEVKLRERISSAFRTEGLDPLAYLRTMPWLPRSRFLSFLDEMDIYLDCPAFSGYTTAWQALHRGLPIVTLEGQYLRQRLAAGLLRQVGATEGVTVSREQYVATAIGWAEECRDTERWAARRAELQAVAPRAEGNRAAVLAFEQKLLEAH
jgi:predicted O-linked N-acetylglucosamine transferase (SPINDLY family)